MPSRSIAVNARFHQNGIVSHNSEIISNGLGKRPEIRPAHRDVQKLSYELGTQIEMRQLTGCKEPAPIDLNPRVRAVNRPLQGQRYEHPRLHHENVVKPKLAHVQNRHARLNLELSNRKAARVNLTTRSGALLNDAASPTTDDTDTQSSSVSPSRDASLVSSQAINAMQPAANSARTTAAIGRKVCIAAE